MADGNLCLGQLEMRLAEADESVLTALERYLLDRDVLEEGMTRALAANAAGEPNVGARRTELRV